MLSEKNVTRFRNQNGFQPRREENPRNGSASTLISTFQPPELRKYKPFVLAPSLSCCYDSLRQLHSKKTDQLVGTLTTVALCILETASICFDKNRHIFQVQICLFYSVMYSVSHIKLCQTWGATDNKGWEWAHGCEIRSCHLPYHSSGQPGRAMERPLKARQSTRSRTMPCEDGVWSPGCHIHFKSMTCLWCWVDDTR